MVSHAQRRPARFSELEALPDNVVGEILAGELHVSPRPSSRHAVSTSQLTAELITRFRPRRGGDDPPTGWHILVEPELHLGDDVVVPDLAGWRAEQMPTVPDVAFFEQAPNWICEVLSPSTQRIDRMKKMPIYARAAVGYVWLVEPRDKRLDVFALHERSWTLALSAGDDDVVRAAPFEEFGLDLSLLW